MIDLLFSAIAIFAFDILRIFAEAIYLFTDTVNLVKNLKKGEQIS